MDFKDLEIWRLSFVLNKKIYEATLSFPGEEIYALTSQIRRASVSISSNIAEGYGRGTNKDFRNFLYNARGSLREVESQLLIAKNLKYIKNSDFDKIYAIVKTLSAKLIVFIQRMKI